MTADQIIEVLQAWKEKKRIQYRLVGYDTEWVDRSLLCDVPEDFKKYEWRVKPEQRKPREFWIHLQVAADWTAFGSLADAERAEKESIYAITERVHVREVMDDEDEKPTETEDNRKVWLRTDLVEEDYASLSVLPNFDSKDEPAYFYYASELRKHPELRKYVIGG